MQTFVGLVRGINVGGHHKLPMADLRAICESAGLDNVRTYIQSGNLVFRAKKTAAAIAAKLESEIAARFGFQPRILILPSDDFCEAAREYPFPVTDHKFAHLMFLDSQPDEDAIARLKAVDHAPDEIAVGTLVVNIYLPNGVSGARTNLSKIESTLGVNGTARNWRTVQKLIEMSS